VLRQLWRHVRDALADGGHRPQCESGLRELARQQRAPGWNFNKYLVAADGKVTAYFDSSIMPESPQLNRAIATLLN
jgi:glutathione peroxidase-family protein